MSCPDPPLGPRHSFPHVARVSCYSSLTDPITGWRRAEALSRAKPTPGLPVGLAKASVANVSQIDRNWEKTTHLKKMPLNTLKCPLLPVHRLERSIDALILFLSSDSPTWNPLSTICQRLRVLRIVPGTCSPCGNSQSYYRHSWGPPWPHSPPLLLRDTTTLNLPCMNPEHSL